MSAHPMPRAGMAARLAQPDVTDFAEALQAYRDAKAEYFATIEVDEERASGEIDDRVIATMNRMTATPAPDVAAVCDKLDVIVKEIDEYGGCCLDRRCLQPVFDDLARLGAEARHDR